MTRRDASLAWLAYKIEGRGGSEVWQEVFGVANFTGRRVLPCFTHLIFYFSGDFSLISSILNIFGGRFSHFRHFSDSAIRLTSTAEVTLYYDPSKMSTQAGQLGPRAYRIFHFCPACGFRILGKACFTQIMLKYCRGTVHGTHRTHRTHGRGGTHR